MKERLIETESFVSWLEEDIIYYIFKKNKVELPEAKEAVETTIAIAQDEPHGYFFDISCIKSITKEAREYLSIPRSTEKNRATAALAPNVMSKLIGTFFMTFSNPGVKIKLFTNQDEAIKWLKASIAKTI